MSISLRLLFPALSLLLAASNSIVPAASAAEFQWKFASINAATTSAYTDVLVPYARDVERESGGRIAIDIQPLGGFGKPIELLPLVEAGKIDIAVTVQGYHPGRFPRTSVMELPTVFQRAEDGSRALWTMYQDGLIAPEYQGLKVLALYVSRPFGILVADKSVNSLRDLRGMRIRVAGITIGLAFARLGLTPLGLPTNMMGPALANGWVDALSFSFSSAVGTPGKPPGMVIDQVSTLIDAEFSAPTLMMVMNQKSFDALPADLKAVVDRLSGLRMSVLSGQGRDRDELTVKRQLAADPRFRMFQFSAADKAEIDRRIAPVFDEWASGLKPLGIDGPALLKHARDLSAPPSS